MSNSTMFSLFLLGPSLLFEMATAQNFYDDWGQGTLLCNSTINDANASYTRTFNVSYPRTNGGSFESVPDPTWAITVDQSSNATQTSIWYDTAGQNYSDDLSLRYDVCSGIFQGLPINTIQLAQDDPGDCSSTLSESCRNVLMQNAEEAATLWTTYASPPPYSNLSSGVTGYICNKILEDLSGGSGQQFPKECETDIGGTSLGITLAALTSYNSSVQNDNCSLTGSADQMFHRVQTTSGASDVQTYDDAVHNVYPVLSVWFTVANVERTECCQPSKASLTCLRANNIASGSRVSPALPAGKPYKRSTGLSKGAIAGIVVAIVVVLVVIVLFSARWYRRRQRGTQPLATTDPDDEPKLPQLDGEAYYELSSQKRPPEVDSASLHELSSKKPPLEVDSTFVHELSSKEPPSEMGGSRIRQHGSKEKPVELA